jgi:hypothetical protein
VNCPKPYLRFQIVLYYESVLINYLITYYAKGVDRDGTAWNREENEHKGGRSIFLERNTCIGFLVGVLFNHYMGRRLLFIFRSFLKALFVNFVAFTTKSKNRHLDFYDFQ